MFVSLSFTIVPNNASKGYYIFKHIFIYMRLSLPPPMEITFALLLISVVLKTIKEIGVTNWNVFL